MDCGHADSRQICYKIYSFLYIITFHSYKSMVYIISNNLKITKFKLFFRLSSAGLIYCHYGQQVIQEILKKDSIEPSTDCLEKLFFAVYDGFVEELDAIDNGVPMYTEGCPRYRINTHLSARVHKYNPEWNSPANVSLQELFEKAMVMVGNEFKDKVLEVITT